MGKMDRMRFYAFILFIALTATSALSSANLQCEIAISDSKLHWLGIPDSALLANASGKTMVKTDVLLDHYQKQVERIKTLSVDELFERFQKLVEIEYSEFGGLVGIADVKPVVLDFVKDLGIPRSDDEIVSSSKRDWATYYRNQLQSQTFLYPNFFRDNITAPAFPAIPVRLQGSYMAPPTDFRLYIIIIQRELMKRIINQPSETLARLGLEYPADDRILRESLDDLRGIVHP